MEKESLDIANMFSELCVRAPIETLQHIKADVQDLEGPLGDKIRAVVDRHLEQKIVAHEKTTFA